LEETHCIPLLPTWGETLYYRLLGCFLTLHVSWPFSSSSPSSLRSRPLAVMRVSRMQGASHGYKQKAEVIRVMLISRCFDARESKSEHFEAVVNVSGHFASRSNH
jgi:hypothetical protein